MRKNNKVIVNLQGIQGILNKDGDDFPVTIKQGQVTICLRCLSDKLSTVLQHLFKDIMFSKNKLKDFIQFTVHHISLWRLVA